MTDPICWLIAWFIISLWQPSIVLIDQIPHFRIDLSFAVIALLLAIWRFRKLVRRARPNTQTLLMLLFAILTLISILYAADRKTAFQSWQETFMQALGTFALMWLIVATPKRAIRLITGGAMILAIYAAWYNGINLWSSSPSPDAIPSLNLEQNHNAILLGMSVPLAYTLLASVQSWAIKTFWAIISLLGAHAVLLSGSKTAVVACTAALCYLIAMHKPRWQAMVGALALIILLTPFFGLTVREQLITYLPEDNQSVIQNRLVLWSQGMKSITANPIRGANLQENITDDSNDVQSISTDVKNHYIQIALDHGLPILVLFVSMLFVGWWSLMRFRRKLKQHIPGLVIESKRIRLNARATSLGIEACLMVYMVSALLNNMNGFNLIWVLLMLSVRIGDFVEWPSRPSPSPPPSPKKETSTITASID